MRRLADLVARWPWAVIGAWAAIAVALLLTFPSLNEMAQRHPLAILPSDAPSSVAARQMTEAFHESGRTTFSSWLLSTKRARTRRRRRLPARWSTRCGDDVTDVVMVQDFFTTPNCARC